MNITGLRELYESDDPWFIAFVRLVVDRTIEYRNEQAKKKG